MANLQRKTLEAAAERLRLAIRQLTLRLRLLSAKHELTWSQLAAMARIESLGTATTATLARAEVVRPQSMGATLASLEELGLITRSADPTDGRQLLYELTASGKQIRAEASAIKHAWMAQSIRQLSPQQQRILIQAIAIMEKMGKS